MYNYFYFFWCILKLLLIILFEQYSILYLDKSIDFLSYNKPLYDIFHLLSDKYLNKSYFPLLIYLKEFLCYLPFLFMISFHPFYFISLYTNSYIIIRILRNLFFWITILPLIDKPRKINSIIDITNYGGNGDLMFSGHIVSSFISIIAFMNFYNISFNFFIFLYMFSISFLIIITKCHYSIDVLTAYFILYSVLKFMNLL